MIRYIIKLSHEEVIRLRAIINKGSHSTKTFRTAYILLNCDVGDYSDKVTNDQISKVLKVGMRTIDRVKKRFIEEGFEAVLERRESSRIYDENYNYFSSYSYFDEKNENIKFYKNYAVRAYIEPSIKYKLINQLRTLYENNATDMIGFLAELELAGNKNTELIVLQPEDNTSTSKSTQATWNAINKNELMDWIQKQTEK